MITFKLYRAADGYRWRAVAKNGKVIADGSEAYVNKADAQHSIDLLIGAGRDGSYALVDMTVPEDPEAA